MKKWIVAILLLCLLPAVSGCGDGSGQSGSGIRLPEQLSVEVGQSVFVKAEFADGWSDFAVTWSVSDDSVLRLAVPSQSILPHRARIDGLATGTATVTARAADGQAASVTVTVTAPADTPSEGEDGNRPGTPEEPEDDFVLTADVLNVAVGGSAAMPVAGSDGAVYSSEDASVATVSETGLVTGVAAGTTYVSAEREGVTLRLKVGVADPDAGVMTLSDVSEPRIAVYGRTKFDDTLNAQMLYFSASGFDVAFYGTELKAVFCRESGDTYVPYLSVFVDGESRSEVVPIGSDRVVRVESKAAAEYTLVSGLEQGWHIVSVRKRTAFQRGSTQMDTVGIQSLSTDGCFGYVPDKPDLRIDVYGDSYSCGYGNLEDGSSMTSENTDANLAYHALLADEIGAELTVMAASGWGVYRGNDGTNVWSWADKYDKLNTKSAETVPTSGADVIIINLGTNDVAGGAFSVTDTTEAFKAAYTGMLTGLREENPEALILCTYGFVSTNTACRTAITEVVADMNDDNIKAYFYTTVHSATGHPDVANHRNGARELKTVLDTYGILG